jgi:hypothetical protein
MVQEGELVAKLAPFLRDAGVQAAYLFTRTLDSDHLETGKSQSPDPMVATMISCGVLILDLLAAMSRQGDDETLEVIRNVILTKDFTSTFFSLAANVLGVQKETAGQTGKPSVVRVYVDRWLQFLAEISRRDGAAARLVFKDSEGQVLAVLSSLLIPSNQLSAKILTGLRHRSPGNSQAENKAPPPPRAWVVRLWRAGTVIFVPNASASSNAYFILCLSYFYLQH